MYERKSQVRGVSLFIAACLMAFAAPYFHVKPWRADADIPFPGWSACPAVQGMTPIALSDAERRFDRSFPGRTAKFSDNRRTILVRWITKATRKLHPVEDCYKAIGYTTKHEPLLKDPDGLLWGRIICEKGSERLTARERIYDDYGRSWTDDSAWYWNALLGRSKGPWWSTTIVEKDGK
jgi:hypothetical protein